MTTSVKTTVDVDAGAATVVVLGVWMHLQTLLARAGSADLSDWIAQSRALPVQVPGRLVEDAFAELGATGCGEFDGVVTFEELRGFTEEELDRTRAAAASAV